jgi:hypothetical protein
MQYDSTKLRAYFFGNLYISQIQHGIQGSHVVTKMFRDNQPDLFPADPVMQRTLFDWGDDGVTKIYLQAGYQRNLEIIHDVLRYICPRLGLPYQKFHEEVDALNGALTSVGVVVPQEIYDMDKVLPGYVETMRNPVYGVLRNVFTPTDVYNTLLRMRRHDGEDYAKALMLLLHITLKSAKLA